MKTVKIPFTEKNIFKYKGKYYRLTKGKCSDCCFVGMSNREYCNEFINLCGGGYSFSLVYYYEILFNKETDCIIDFPIDIHQIYEWENKYYRLFEAYDCENCASCETGLGVLCKYCLPNMAFEKIERGGDN